MALMFVCMNHPDVHRLYSNAKNRFSILDDKTLKGVSQNSTAVFTNERQITVSVFTAIQLLLQPFSFFSSVLSHFCWASDHINCMNNWTSVRLVTLLELPESHQADKSV